MSTEDFHFYLPDWPPQRLIREATLSWSLRHLDEPKLDPEASPWPLLRTALLAYLRHNLSGYDERLRTRYEHDPKYRDELAAQVAAAAYRKYRWLRDDPRPFPEQPDDSQPRLFTELARNLAHYHSSRDHLTSAIRDLKREGKQAQVAELQRTLAKIEQRIADNYAILTGPKYSYGLSGEGESRAFGFPHLPEEMGHYFFFDNRPITPNRYHYLGFRCPQCGVPVVKYKQRVDFGQGFRMIVHSCHCHTTACVCPPPTHTIAPMTAQKWAAYTGTPNDGKAR
jgi:hypothetical protein